MSEDKNNTLLGIRDIVIMNVIAILSLRQIPNVAPYGASAMLLWLLAAVCLFLPLAMVCGELSTGWPERRRHFRLGKGGLGQARRLDHRGLLPLFLCAFLPPDAAIRLYGARLCHLARIGREPDIHRCELHCDLLVPHLHEH